MFNIASLKMLVLWLRRVVHRQFGEWFKLQCVDVREWVNLAGTVLGRRKAL